MKTIRGTGQNLTVLGFRQHKDFWIATDREELEEEIGNLPRLLAQQLAGWEAFSFDPEDETAVSKPEWIDSAMCVKGDYLLIWHPNISADATGEPNVQYLSMH